MKKNVTIIIIVFAIAHIAIAQDSDLINLRHNLSVAKDDTSRVNAMDEYCNYYKEIKPDSALFYGYQALPLAREIKFHNGEFETLILLIFTQLHLGNESKALQLIFQAEKIANTGYEKATLVLNKGSIYEFSKDYTKALNLYREGKKIFDSINDSIFSPFAQLAMGKMYLEKHQPDSALYHCETAYKNALQVKDNWVPRYILLQLGRVQDELGNTELALSYFRQALANALDTATVCRCYLSIAQLYHRIGKQDSAFFYATRSFELARKNGLYNDIIDASLFLSQIYENKDFQQALLYSKNAIIYKDSLRKMAESATQETFADLGEQERQREIEDAKAEFKNQFQIYALIGITFTFLIIASLLYRSSRLKQKAKQNIVGYEPAVTVSVRKVRDRVELRVSDNGSGVPEKILGKIFQPFFTTKPTGQGTGLGLSLSYDIIKAHGGEIKVETKEGEGSEFIIQLPA